MDKVIQIIAIQLGYQVEEVMLDSTLKEMGADCLDEVEILMEIEKQFNVMIDDEEFELCKNVSDIIELVNNTIDKK